MQSQNLAEEQIWLKNTHRRGKIKETSQPRMQKSLPAQECTQKKKGRGQDETTFFCWWQLALSQFKVVMEAIHWEMMEGSFTLPL